MLYCNSQLYNYDLVFLQFSNDTPRRFPRVITGTLVANFIRNLKHELTPFYINEYDHLYGATAYSWELGAITYKFLFMTRCKVLYHNLTGCVDQVERRFVWG